MKTLLLLGDSIRMFYCEEVARQLKGRMNVVWPEENCRYTIHTLRNLFEYEQLVEDPAEVAAVHWNNGLWDITRRTVDGEPLVSPEDYERALGRIIVELRGRFPNAVIIFATTTCVNDALTTAKNEDVVRYNEVALRVMKKNGIPIDDLYRIMADHPEYIRDDLIHETEEGARVLAKQVADCVLEHLAGTV